MIRVRNIGEIFFIEKRNGLNLELDIYDGEEELLTVKHTFPEGTTDKDFEKKIKEAITARSL